MVGGGGLLLGSSDEEAIELLPPGFRFHPTDEEIIMHYLLEKAVDRGFTARAISEADLNKCEPWDLPEKAKMGEKEWFFFFQRDRKYPTGMRTNRATESGYWKATGKDKEIYYKPKNYLVGMKKTLVFYKGRAPKGDKTNWVMHEYRLDGDVSNYNINISRAAKEEFVVCRVFHKTTGIRRPAAGMLPPLMDYTNYNMEGPRTRLSTNYDHKEEGTNIHEYSYSSSRVFLNNQLLQNQLQYPQYNYHDSTNDTTLLQNPSFTFPAASIFPNYQPQTSLGYQLSQGLGSSSVISSYHHPNINIFPFKGNSRIMNPKREQYISTNNSMIISHSKETGLISTEESKGGEVESENIIIKAFDDQELDGLGFGPTISDLDSLWGY